MDGKKYKKIMTNAVATRSIEHDPIRSYVVPTVPDKN
jgi:hypothetical protein